MTERSFMRPGETFHKNMCLTPWTPPSPKSHTYCPSPCLFGAVSQSCWAAVSRAALLILPQMQLHSQLSSCAFFKWWQKWAVFQRFTSNKALRIHLLDAIYFFPVTTLILVALPRQILFHWFLTSVHVKSDAQIHQVLFPEIHSCALGTVCSCLGASAVVSHLTCSFLCFLNWCKLALTRVNNTKIKELRNVLPLRLCSLEHHPGPQLPLQDLLGLFWKGFCSLQSLAAVQSCRNLTSLFS